jgi:hypothetical protein
VIAVIASPRILALFFWIADSLLLRCFAGFQIRKETWEAHVTAGDDNTTPLRKKWRVTARGRANVSLRHLQTALQDLCARDAKDPGLEFVVRKYNELVATWACYCASRR